MVPVERMSPSVPPPRRTSSPAVAPPAAVDALLAWGEATRRDLPWRRTRDPWAVLVSELMLQQTQVPRVIPRYLAFLERFPTPAACAAADAGEVVALWHGLGYNRRAVRLHRGGGGRGGRPGRNAARLPGRAAGPSRRGPVHGPGGAGLRLDADVGVVDVNAARVHARLTGAALGARELQARRRHGAGGGGVGVEPGRAGPGRHGVPGPAGRVWRCPLRTWCRWAATGCAGPDPAAATPGVSRPQGRFEGSDRQGRGRLVNALRRGPVPLVALAVVMGWPEDPERAARVAAAWPPIGWPTATRTAPATGLTAAGHAGPDALRPRGRGSPCTSV